MEHQVGETGGGGRASGSDLDVPGACGSEEAGLSLHLSSLLVKKRNKNKTKPPNT